MAPLTQMPFEMTVPLLLAALCVHRFANALLILPRGPFGAALVCAAFSLGLRLGTACKPWRMLGVKPLRYATQERS